MLSLGQHWVEHLLHDALLGFRRCLRSLSCFWKLDVGLRLSGPALPVAGSSSTISSLIDLSAAAAGHPFMASGDVRGDSCKAWCFMAQAAPRGTEGSDLQGRIQSNPSPSLHGAMVASQ